MVREFKRKYDDKVDEFLRIVTGFDEDFTETDPIKLAKRVGQRSVYIKIRKLLKQIKEVE